MGWKMYMRKAVAHGHRAVNHGSQIPPNQTEKSLNNCSVGEVSGLAWNPFPQLVKFVTWVKKRFQSVHCAL